MAHRVIRIAAFIFGVFWILAGCLAQGPSSAGGPIGGAAAGDGASGNGSAEVVAPAGNGAADDTAAEPKPLPGGIASGTTDMEDPDPEAIAYSSILGTFTKVCAGEDFSQYRIDASIVTHWVGSDTDSCLPMFNRKLVSVVTVDGEEFWTLHAVDEECRITGVFAAPTFGPRKFYNVKCEGFFCKPKPGDLPLPSLELKAPYIAQVPPLCLQLN